MLLLSRESDLDATFGVEGGLETGVVVAEPVVDPGGDPSDDTLLVESERSRMLSCCSEMLFLGASFDGD